MMDSDLPQTKVPCGWITVTLFCLTLFSGTTLCSLGYFIVRPNLRVRDFTIAKCSVYKITDMGSYPCKWCEGTGRHSVCHQSTFPCRQVWVLATKEQNFTSYIHSDIQHYQQNKECSYTACDKYGSEAKITSGLRLWTLGSSNRCYINMDDSRIILGVRDYNERAVVYSILWPSLVLVISAVILTLRCSYYFRWCQCIIDRSTCQSYTRTNRCSCWDVPTPETPGHHMDEVQRY